MKLGLDSYSYHLAFGAHPDFTPRRRLTLFGFIERVSALGLDGFQIDPLHLGAREKKLTYLLALFGQASLPIYTAHSFVLPALNWLDYWVVIEGIGRIALPFVLFAVYCGIVMDYYHRKGLRPRAAPRAA